MADLTLYSNICSLAPWPDFLEPLLTYTKRTFDPFNNRYNAENIRMYMAAPDGSGSFPLGFRSRVERTLAARGIPLTTHDLRKHVGKPRTVRLDKVEPLRPGQAKALAAVLAHDRGVVVQSTGWGKSFLIRQVCLALPGERFLIISPGRDDVLGLAKRLSEGMPSKAVGVVGAGRNEPGRRITVATAKSIPKADIESITFVIVDEAHQCGDNLISRYLGHLGECYMFGFTASPGMRSDGADMVMEALFGEVIAKGEYQEAVDNGNVVPLEVRLYPAPGSPCYKKKTVARRRECYWRNQGRNKLIARLAGEFPDDEQVLVMVDTIEHGLFLRKEMPGFTFVYRPPSKEDWEMYRRMGLVGADEEPISRKAQDSAADDFRSGKLTKVISTGVWKQAVDFPDLSVLIRADGGGSGIGSIQIPGRLSRLSDGKDKGILIDFNDDFDAWPQTRSLKRKGFYKKQGWEIKNVK